MRVYNFSAGPSMLPLEVLQTAQSSLLNYDNSGMSITEMSHRSKNFMAVNDEAQALLREYREIRAFLTGKAENDDADVMEGAEKGAAHGTV